MSQLTFLRHLVRSTPAIAYSRAMRGPARPSWSFSFEVFAAAMRRLQFDVAGRTWQAQRRAMDSLADTYSPMQKRVRRERTTMSGVPAEWFTPHRPADIETTLLYTHGGGYVFGSVKTHAETIARIALAAPARTLAPEYRLAPEYPFPAAIDDVVAVYRALLTSGVDPKKLVVAGDSAGGGLTMALLQRLKAAGDPMPAGAALICPWVDLSAVGGSLETNATFDWGNEAIGHKWIAAYLNGHDAKDPLASAVFADLTGLPPLLIQVGQAELLYDQDVALAERAKDCGVDARLVVGTDMIHDWHTFAGLFPDCGRPIDEIGGFVREVTKT